MYVFKLSLSLSLSLLIFYSIHLFLYCEILPSLCPNTWYISSILSGFLLLKKNKYTCCKKVTLFLMYASFQPSFYYFRMENLHPSIFKMLPIRKKGILFEYKEKRSYSIDKYWDKKMLNQLQIGLLHFRKTNEQTIKKTLSTLF